MNQAMMNHNHAIEAPAAAFMKKLDAMDALCPGAPVARWFQSAVRRPFLKRLTAGNSTSAVHIGLRHICKQSSTNQLSQTIRISAHRSPTQLVGGQVKPSQTSLLQVKRDEKIPEPCFLRTPQQQTRPSDFPPRALCVSV